ncbi:MAG: hypothetical protein IRY98_01835 [Alicyclobacillaceae bacterium]|nr:hypothetical protein [Alicyclobacillaceae bacterium]
MKPVFLDPSKGEHIRSSTSRGLTGTLLLLLMPALVAPLLSGCAERARELREQQIPSHPRILDDRRDLSRVPRDSRGVYGNPAAGLQSARNVADRLNNMPGIRGAVVLIRNQTAYVGFHQIGPEDNPDAGRNYERGTLKEKPASPGTRVSQTGHLDHRTAVRVENIVREALPGIRVVRITTETTAVSELQGYAAYIEDGGDVSRWIDRFQQTVRRIWH